MTWDWLLTLPALSPYVLAATTVVLTLIRNPAQIEHDRHAATTSAPRVGPTSAIDPRPPARRHNCGNAARGVIPMAQMRGRHLDFVRTIVARALVALAFLALLTGTGMLPAAQAQDAAPSVQAQDEAAVSIANFAFQPSSLQVAVGTTVTWTNSDSTAHTVTSDTGAFDAGPLAPGVSFTQTFMTPGTYTYHCQIHPFMTGTIVVS